jgi:hypothetical protein
LDAYFVVRDHSGQAVAYVYFEDDVALKIKTAISEASRPITIATVVQSI